ncbi:hypothetical protein KEM48_005384 [Puccinia striiformis f. sp. tritici PST-130]|nr:hypothetical protein KEM48_005384 [Puccinia striiformis f. sp. tritici PST-130]
MPILAEVKASSLDSARLPKSLLMCGGSDSGLVCIRQNRVKHSLMAWLKSELKGILSTFSDTTYLAEVLPQAHTNQLFQRNLLKISNFIIMRTIEVMFKFKRQPPSRSIVAVPRDEVPLHVEATGGGGSNYSTCPPRRS